MQVIKNFYTFNHGYVLMTAEGNNASSFKECVKTIKKNLACVHDKIVFEMKTKLSVNIQKLKTLLSNLKSDD